MLRAGVYLRLPKVNSNISIYRMSGTLTENRSAIQTEHDGHADEPLD
jgi:hypothetical protein